MQDCKFEMPINTSLGYDSCSLRQRTLETSRPGDYYLSRPLTTDCFQDFKSHLDTESELKGLGYLNSKCQKDKLENYNKIYTPHCETYLIPENSRTFKSCSGISQISTFRPNFPIEQSKFHSNSYIGDNTRLSARNPIPLKYPEIYPTNIKRCEKVFNLNSSLDCSVINYKSVKF